MVNIGISRPQQTMPHPIWVENKQWFTQWMQNGRILLPGVGWYCFLYKSTGNGPAYSHLSVEMYLSRENGDRFEDIASIPLPRNDQTEPGYAPLNHGNESPIFFDVKEPDLYFSWRFSDEFAAMRGFISVMRVTSTL